MQERVYQDIDPDTAERVEALRSYQEHFANPVRIEPGDAKAKAAAILRAAMPNMNRASRRAFLANFAKQVKADKRAKAGKGA